MIIINLIYWKIIPLNLMHIADPVQTHLFFEGGKILNEKDSGTARAGC